MDLLLMKRIRIGKGIKEGIRIGIRTRIMKRIRIRRGKRIWICS